MAEISAQVVKSCAKNAGMMDCKKALKETDGDMTKATEWLRQRASPPLIKAGRVAAEEGLRPTSTQSRVGVLG